MRKPIAACIIVVSTISMSILTTLYGSDAAIYVILIATLSGCSLMVLGAAILLDTID